MLVLACVVVGAVIYKRRSAGGGAAKRKRKQTGYLAKNVVTKPGRDDSVLERGDLVLARKKKEWSCFSGGDFS